MKKRIITILLATVSIFTASAQKGGQFGFYLGGGGQSLLYKPDTLGKATLGGGFTLGAEYRYFFNDNIGLGTGLNISTYSSKLKLGESMISNDAYDALNDVGYQLQTTYSGCVEKQNIFAFEIPVAFYFQTKPSKKKINLLGDLGFKLGFPVWNNYKSSGEYTTQYCDTLTGVPIHDVPVHGLSTYDLAGKGRNNFRNLSFMVMADLGFNYELSSKKNLKTLLYVGAYFNCGLSNLIRKDEARPDLMVIDFRYGQEVAPQYAGALNSSHIQKAFPISFGLKVGITLCKQNASNKKGSAGSKPGTSQPPPPAQATPPVTPAQPTPAPAQGNNTAPTSNPPAQAQPAPSKPTPGPSKSAWERETKKLQEANRQLMSEKGELAKANSALDSKNKEYAKKIQDMEATIADLRAATKKNRTADYDTLAVQYCMIALRLQWNEARVKRAIAHFNNISDRTFKNDNMVYKELLTNYKTYQVQFRNILLNMQKNPNRTTSLEVTKKRFIADCKKIIEEWPYYQTYKTDPNVRSIRFLDEQIDLVLQMLDDFESGAVRELNFERILSKLK